MRRLPYPPVFVPRHLAQIGADPFLPSHRTPIGQAIGLATHTLYSPSSSFGLILVGTMNAISSGLLVYASLVELVAVDFISDESWEILRGKKRVAACLTLFAGALCMGLVGAWA